MHLIPSLPPSLPQTLPGLGPVLEDLELLRGYGAGQCIFALLVVFLPHFLRRVEGGREGVTEEGEG